MSCAEVDKKPVVEATKKFDDPAQDGDNTNTNNAVHQAIRYCILTVTVIILPPRDDDDEYDDCDSSQLVRPRRIHHHQ